MVFLYSLSIAGEASTYFEIFVPPNNDPVGRDVCLIVTAIYDSTTFHIVDDGGDGDTDDTHSGVLMSGQSYVMYIRDNGVNDDAPHQGEGTTKQDGDFFIVTADNLILTSQSTNSDWQHDWVPATNKSSLGKRFIIYSPPTSFSNRDLNVFAYEDNTEVTIRKVSWASQLTSGYTNVDMTSSEIVVQRTLDIGQDIIFHYQNGRNVMENGHTYVIETNKPVSVQYGALWQNARDGGGYVPSSNGSSSGELFYFTVPFQKPNEQEIRIVSWDDNNTVVLDKYQNGSWTNITSWNLNELDPGDWVSYNGNISSTFRVTCSSGKKVSVFEANWMETGSPGTSDMASMVSSENGTTAGNRFLVYMAPPGRETNVTNPVTGLKYDYGSHIYLFARDTANITVVDANTSGNVINRSYTILPGSYIDCFLNRNEWYSIYNGDGNANSGPDRPYLFVSSDNPISVFNTNFNDNWMSYFGTSQLQDFAISDSTSSTHAIPGDTVSINTSVELNDNLLTSTELQVIVGDGATIINSQFADQTNQVSYTGQPAYNNNTNQTEVSFSNLPDLDPQNQYEVQTSIVLNVNYQTGEPIQDRTVVSTETILSGIANNVYQQTSVSSGILNETSNQSNLIFSRHENTSNPIAASGNSWSVSFVDFDGNGFDDIFIPNYDEANSNELYKNRANGTFTRISSGPLVTDISSSVTSTWADYDNDGKVDAYIANNKDQKNLLIRNLGANQFQKITSDESVNDKGYSHGASWGDYNNDGYIDIFVSDFFPTRFNKLYKNNGDGSFSKASLGDITNETSHSIGASWVDYDNDGDLDLYVTNYNNSRNSLYKNNGNETFTKITTGEIVTDTFNSTGSSWADIDNDGDQDVFVTNASNQNNCLYVNNGNSTFTRITEGQIVTDGGNSHGSAWGDIDNDGDQDLIVTNDQNGPKFLYINDGTGNFIKNTFESLTARAGNTFGAALSDIDRDGDLDLFIANHNNEENFFYTNNGNDNNWFEARLEGTNSNRSAIGAKIRVKANIDGTDLWQYREISAQTGGGAGSQNSLVAHFGLKNATIIDSIIINWPSGYEQTLTAVSVNQYMEIQEENGGLVSGKVFNDLNGNCIQDDNESGLENIIIEITPGPKYTNTNEQGEYSISLKPGSYTLTKQTNQNWSDYCLENGEINVNVSSIGEQLPDNDFPVSALVSQPDLEVEIGATAFRRGFVNQISLTVKNTGTIPAKNVVLSTTLHEDIYALSSIPVWNDKEQQTVNWYIDSLDINQTSVFHVEDSIDLYSPLGDMLNIDLTASSDETDLDISNNTLSYTDTVVGSVDPNDIRVEPNTLVNKYTNLNYHIRFQNIGNYYASIVKIIDTIPDELNMSTINFGPTSHPCEIFVEDNVVTWLFNDIILPDSTSNEPESHGFVKFEISPHENTLEGRRIYNKAHIRFDYNDYLITNTVENIFSHPYDFDNTIDHNVIIFPNPFSHLSIVRVTQKIGKYDPVIISDIEFTNINGRTVYSEHNIFKPEHYIGDMDLTPGFYTIKITDDKGNIHFGKLVVKQTGY